LCASADSKEPNARKVIIRLALRRPSYIGTTGWSEPRVQPMGSSFKIAHGENTRDALSSHFNISVPAWASKFSLPLVDLDSRAAVPFPQITGRLIKLRYGWFQSPCIKQPASPRLVHRSCRWVCLEVCEASIWERVYYALCVLTIIDRFFVKFGYRILHPLPDVSIVQ
jgi:hypothetical protein